MKEKQRIIKSSFVYLGTSILNKLLPFLLLPILTQYLTPADYGTLAMFTAIFTLLSPVIGAALQIHILRNFFKLSKTEMASLMGNIFVILGSFTAVAFLCLFFYSFFSYEIAGISMPWLSAIIVICFCSGVYQLNLALLRNQHKVFLFGAYELSNTAVNLTLSLLWVVIFLMNWRGRAIAMLLTAVVFAIASIVHIFRNGYLVLNFDWKRIKELLKISLPLIPHTLGMMVIFISDRFFIDAMSGKQALGLYATAYSFGMGVGLITDSFNRAWSPWIHEKLVNLTEERKLQVVWITYLYGVGLLFFAGILSYVSAWALQVMTTKDYHGAVVFIPWVAFAYAVDGMYKMVSHYLIHTGKTSFLGFSTFFAAVVNLVCNYYLIKMNGPIGAAQATLIAYICTFSLTWWYASRIYPMPWFNLKIISGFRKLST